MVVALSDGARVVPSWRGYGGGVQTVCSSQGNRGASLGDGDAGGSDVDASGSHGQVVIYSVEGASSNARQVSPSNPQRDLDSG